MPTPLGNLRDMTMRALDVLRECDLVVAEDTRVARRLLSAYGIAGKPLVSYREQNAAAATAAILARAAVERVAVVTDAGMPAVSDPGRELIAAAREAGVPVDVLPGPVAFICAAVLSGFDLTGLEFAGFVPRAPKAREAALRRALARDGATAWYESPQRVVATLEALAALAPDSRVFVGRELTKAFEQQILATPAAALAALERPVRGEIVVVLETPPAAPAPLLDGAMGALDAAIDALLDVGLSVADVAKALAPSAAGGRSEVYARAAARKGSRGDGGP